MTPDLLLSVTAVVSLLPVALLGTRRDAPPDGLYWALLIVAVAGPITWVMSHMSGTWRTGFSTAMWVTVAATMAVFLVVAVASPRARRLTILILPYMVIVGLLATLWQQAPERALSASAPGAWVGTHIVVSVLTYALVTIAAVAALAAAMQERALKSKQPTPLSRRLPSVADSEALLVRLLIFGEIVLGLGLATGMVAQYGETGAVLIADHKTILTITAFMVIGGLLIAQKVSGVRGRMATRTVLLAYLLLTLGYPGVKFVTDVVLA
jgi:ABC-type uncharacterized transport system permease subunit